jgi:hypothetical protein
MTDLDPRYQHDCLKAEKEITALREAIEILVVAVNDAIKDNSSENRHRLIGVAEWSSGVLMDSCALLAQPAEEEHDAEYEQRAAAEGAACAGCGGRIDPSDCTVSTGNAVYHMECRPARRQDAAP